MTTQPQRNTPLTADDWQAGDWISHDVMGEVQFDGESAPLLSPHWKWLGRPDQSGWIEHDGRENPAPGLRVDVRFGIDEIEMGFPSTRWSWKQHQGFAITHWRPHVPPPAGEAEECEACHGSGVRPTADGVGHYCENGCPVPAPPQPKGEVEAAGLEVVAWRIRRPTADAGFGRPKTIATDEATEADLWQWRRNKYDIEPLVTLTAAQAALTASQAREARAVEWRKPETLPHPKDAGVFFAAIRVGKEGGPFEWQVHLIALDDETHDVHLNYDQGWRWEDYEFWTPCEWPEPPTRATLKEQKQ